jgi:hypothetical protein
MRKKLGSPELKLFDWVPKTLPIFIQYRGI